MVQAWYFDNDLSVDYREPHKANPPVYLSLEDVYEKTGVEYFKFDADTHENNEEYAELKKKRGYSYEDSIEISRDKLPNYDEKLKMFYSEHIHSDEEIRFIVGGGGYFDVRNKEDQWIRIYVEKNDLLVLPAGIYHRFTIDKSDYIKAKRLFVGEPVWTPINRPEGDGHPAHVEYKRRMAAA